MTEKIGAITAVGLNETKAFFVPGLHYATLLIKRAPRHTVPFPFVPLRRGWSTGTGTLVDAPGQILCLKALPLLVAAAFLRQNLLKLDPVAAAQAIAVANLTDMTEHLIASIIIIQRNKPEAFLIPPSDCASHPSCRCRSKRLCSATRVRRRLR